MKLIYERIKMLYVLLFFYFLLNVTFKFKQKDKSTIPIAFAIINKYTYPLIVLLTSILYNSKSSSFYLFHIMVSNEFFEENKKK
jgi:hypothetical protein